MNLYIKAIKFLYSNYVGVTTVKFFGKSWNLVKASRIFFPFMLLWGITKLFQVELHFSILDAIFSVLAIIQYLASFTNVIVNEYNRLNKK